MTERPQLPCEMDCPNGKDGHDITFLDGYMACCQHCDFGTNGGALLIQYQELWRECQDYMKERETPAQCIARNRQDTINTLKYLAAALNRAESAESELSAIKALCREAVEAKAEYKRYNAERSYDSAFAAYDRMHDAIDKMRDMER